MNTFTSIAVLGILICISLLYFSKVGEKEDNVEKHEEKVSFTTNEYGEAEKNPDIIFCVLDETGNKTGKNVGFNVGESMEIGRADFGNRDCYCSRRMSILFKKNGEVWMQPIVATNPVFSLDGRLHDAEEHLRAFALKEGQLLRMGRTFLKVQYPVAVYNSTQTIREYNF